ncbi:MAG: HU family DNA-binding protein [Gammaproteobacteria bacterium]|nr:HU family DNA-binding protein [Gammaproteobacteria bacterium]
MFKSDLTQRLIHRMSEKYLSLTDTAIKESVDVILHNIIETMVQHGRMEVRGFGAFDLDYYPARKARDPRTGNTIMMSARHRLRFRAAKRLKRRLNAKPY